VNIYPAEVEEVLVSMPGIADAAVVGIQDPEFGEAVAAFVVCDEGTTVPEEDVKAFCAEQMESHKIPVAIFPIPEIPRTPTGKILKRDLREKLKGE
jgi:acyl-CoA synthetase (AMP-forming)/AMP-acid ligase II